MLRQLRTKAANFDAGSRRAGVHFMGFVWLMARAGGPRIVNGAPAHCMLAGLLRWGAALVREFAGQVLGQARLGNGVTHFLLGRVSLRGRPEPD
jgi:hypothetical protein